MMKKTLMMLCLGALPFLAKATVVEQWLEPIVEIKTMDGEWQIKHTDKLPKPPVKVQGQDGNLVLVKLRRIGLVWVPRTSVRLSEESLQLTCQDTNTVRAKDYQNFGMRGDDEPNFKCLADKDESR